MRVAVTGANGFVGKATLAALAEARLDAIPVVRRAHGLRGERLVGDLSAETEWREVLNGCDCVIHLAARVHVMNERAADPAAEFSTANSDGALALARQSVETGVRRLVFVSSAKTLGEKSTPGRPLLESDPLAPEDPYSISKAEAERALTDFARKSGLELTIIRPPLGYGPGVRANFLSMMRWIDKGIPLPFGAIDNRRSIVGVRNLASLLVQACVHAAAPGGVFHASDGQDVSTAQLMRKLAKALAKPDRLLPVPPSLIGAGLRFVGAGAMAERICGNFQIASKVTCERLDWRPPFSQDEEIARTTAAFRNLVRN